MILGEADADRVNFSFHETWSLQLCPRKWDTVQYSNTISCFVLGLGKVKRNVFALHGVDRVGLDFMSMIQLV